MHPSWNIHDQLAQAPANCPSLLPYPAPNTETLPLDGWAFQQDDAAPEQQPAGAAKDAHGSSSSRSSSSNASGPAQQPQPRTIDVLLVAASKKERTRMVHKRFRQRKKERMNTMQQELGKIQAHVQELTDANDGLQARSAVLTGLLECIDEQAAFTTKYRQAAGPCPPPELRELAALVARSMHMTTGDHLEGRRRYVERVMPLLPAAELAPDGPAMARIRELNDQQRLFCKVLASLDPEPPHIRDAFLDAARLGCPVSSHAGDVQLLYDPDASDHQVWSQVVAVLDLSEEQVRMVLAMHDLIVASLQKLTDEQLSLAAQHDRILATAEAKAKAAIATSSVGMRHAPDDAALALQLHRNMQRQKQTHVIMFWYLCDYLLDDLQYAKLWVHAFPNIPFALSILNVVAAAHA